MQVNFCGPWQIKLTLFTNYPHFILASSCEWNPWSCSGENLKRNNTMISLPPQSGMCWVVAEMNPIRIWASILWLHIGSFWRGLSLLHCFLQETKKPLQQSDVTHPPSAATPPCLVASTLSYKVLSAFCLLTPPPYRGVSPSPPQVWWYGHDYSCVPR